MEFSRTNFFLPLGNSVSIHAKPERFERIAIHISWALSWASKRFEKSAISREVRHLIESSFTKNFAVEEVPEIVVE